MVRLANDDDCVKLMVPMTPFILKLAVTLMVIASDEISNNG